MFDGRAAQLHNATLADSPPGMLLFDVPYGALAVIVDLSNDQILSHNTVREISFPLTMAEEILKYFVRLILITRHELSARASVWSEYGRKYKYISRANFSETGLSRNTFKVLCAHIRFSYQPKLRGDIRSGTYRLMLIDDFVTAFSQHRRAKFSLSWIICIVGSISKWNEINRSYINKEIPVFTSIGLTRKMEARFEILRVVL